MSKQSPQFATLLTRVELERIGYRFEPYVFRASIAWRWNNPGRPSWETHDWHPTRLLLTEAAAVESAWAYAVKFKAVAP